MNQIWQTWWILINDELINFDEYYTEFIKIKKHLISLQYLVAHLFSLAY